MQHEQIQAAARALVERRRDNQPGAQLEPGLQPATAAAALAIQQAVIARYAAQDEGVGGWKCALPISDSGLEQLPVAAPIFSSSIYHQSPCPIRRDAGVCKMEPEIAFRFKHDLPSRGTAYTEQEITAALSGAHLALELIQNRYRASEQVSYLEHLADCLFNQGLYVGPEIALAEAFAAAQIDFTLSHGGDGAAAESVPQRLAGKHPNGYPQVPLFWLVNFLNERGIGMQAGQLVITSSYAGVLEVNPEEEFTLEYVGLGSMTLQFQG